MKKQLALLCALLLLPLVGRAETDTPRQMAENLLTEVYSYTAEEAAAFVYEDNGKDRVTFHPADDPAWTYTMDYAGGQLISCVSPASMDQLHYPGEGSVRLFLQGAREAGWFGHWDDDAREAVRDALERADIPLNTELELALSGGAGAAETLRALFARCWGDPSDWPPVVRTWLDRELAAYGLELPEKPLPEADAVRFTVPGRHGQAGSTVTLTHDGEPAELRELLLHPALAGWKLTDAAWVRYGDRLGSLDGLGLLAFAQGERRMLTVAASWEGQLCIFPLGEAALLPEAPLRLLYEILDRDFELRYELSDGSRLRVRVLPQVWKGDLCLACDCFIREVIRTDAVTGETVRIRPDSTYRHWTIRRKRPGEETAERRVSVNFPANLGAADFRDFPLSEAAAETADAIGMPGDWVCCAGVHLRDKASSHSGDLGTFLPGAWIPVLETQEGTAADWIRTAFGDPVILRGYVSSNYTSLEEYSPVSPAAIAPLPVARALRNIPLRRGTGLFDGKVRDLPENTRMHAVLRRGDWLLVCVPREEPGWFMDPAGTWGFVRLSELQVASTALQLDWLAMEN